MSEESPSDPEKGKAAPGKKAAPMEQIEAKRLQERRAHVKRRLTLLSYHRSFWSGNREAATVSINRFVEAHLHRRKGNE